MGQSEPTATGQGSDIPETQVGSVAWIVEFGSNPPKWWTGRPKNGGTLTYDVRCAMRFARREDAEGPIGHLLQDGYAEGCKAVEHMWVR
jgi:hypothetical protein